MPKERHFGRVSQIAAYVTVGFKRDCNGGRFFLSGNDDLDIASIPGTNS